MKPIQLVCLLFLMNTSSYCQDKIEILEKKTFVLASTIEIKSKILTENRTLNIYLPKTYNEKDSIKYPVIYLLDGSVDEDFIHITGLVQFLSFPWVKSVPESIVIGIANVDRRRDYTFPTTIKKDKVDYPTTGKSANFINFIQNELQPFVEKNYKTNTSRTIIGQSLGGLLATEILFKRPTLFNNYIIVSPSLWWDKGSLLSNSAVVLKANSSYHASVFVASGNEGKTMNEDVEKLVKILKGMPKIVPSLKQEYFSKENHGSILHKAAYAGLEFINRPPFINKQ